MNPIIPITAILIYILMLLLIYFNIIPDPLLIVEYIKNIDWTIIYLIMFLIILLESIVYLWFYLPWQFIAVLLVISYTKWLNEILYLTFISIIAVTFWAFINYYLWYFLSKNSEKKKEKIDYKKLLFSIIHINTISLFIFDQWIKKAPKKIIYLTWLLNLPYYFLMILITYLLKDKVMYISENSYLILVILFLWLFYSIYNKYNKWLNQI